MVETWEDSQRLVVLARRKDELNRQLAAIEREEEAIWLRSEEESPER